MIVQLNTNQKNYGSKQTVVMKQKEFIKIATEKLKHLSQPPFSSSVESFLETGRISGSFLVALKDIHNKFKQ